MRKLPEGYTPLEYIKYLPPAPPKLYLLHGYQTEEDAKNRAKELYDLCPSKEYRILARTEPKIKEYVILLPDIAIKNLTHSERKDLVPLPHEIQYTDYQPRLYRFMSESHIEDFCRDGTLLLTTFKRCQQLEDPNRADMSEGRNLLIGQNRDLKCVFDVGAGDDAIMLCTSLSRNNHLPKGKPYKSCIEILDINYFVQSVTASLLEQKVPVRTVIKGPCVYSGKTIQRTIPTDYIENLLQKPDKAAGEGEIDFDALYAMMSNIGNTDIFFSKPVQYSYENEYRIVWLLDNDVESDQYLVTSPEAAKVCRKIIFE